MSPSTLFIRRPVATTLLTFGVAAAGAVAFFQLPVSPLPQVDFPTISVQAQLPGASPETRDRVLKAAKDLGYSPHIGARTLRQSRPRQIGVAFAPAHATEPDIVEAIYPAAAEHGYRVVLSAQTSTRTTVLAVEELLGYRCASIAREWTGRPCTPGWRRKSSRFSRGVEY